MEKTCRSGPAIGGQEAEAPELTLACHAVLRLIPRLAGASPNGHHPFPIPVAVEFDDPNQWHKEEDCGTRLGWF